MHRFEPNARIADRYIIQSFKGQGALGEVYKARDEVLNRDVAIKILRPHVAGEQGLRKKFLREARTQASINHPNCCTIYDVLASEDGVIVMEFIHGHNLLEVREQHARSELHVIEILVACCRGLAAAHRKSVVHRDISLKNVMIDQERNVKLLDFGFARQLNDYDPASAPVPVGHEFYIPPEKYNSDHIVDDFRADVFSFGVLIYHLVTGNLPYREESKIKRRAQRHAVPPPPSFAQLGGYRLSEWDELQRIAMKAVSWFPEDRYASANELLDDLIKLDRSMHRAAENLSFFDTSALIEMVCPEAGPAGEERAGTTRNHFAVERGKGKAITSPSVIRELWEWVSENSLDEQCERMAHEHVRGVALDAMEAITARRTPPSRPASWRELSEEERSHFLSRTRGLYRHKLLQIVDQFRQAEVNPGAMMRKFLDFASLEDMQFRDAAVLAEAHAMNATNVISLSEQYSKPGYRTILLPLEDGQRYRFADRPDEEEVATAGSSLSSKQADDDTQEGDT